MKDLEELINQNKKCDYISYLWSVDTKKIILKRWTIIDFKNPKMLYNLWIKMRQKS